MHPPGNHGYSSRPGGRPGNLPGDIVVERANFTLYVPIAIGLLISVVLTLLLWVVN